MTSKKLVVPIVALLACAGALPVARAAADPYALVRWASRYSNASNGTEVAHGIAASPDGSRVFVTGQSQADYATVAYDALTGATLWSARYNGPGNNVDYAWAIAASGDGSKEYVTGQSIGATNSVDAATIAYDAATGAQLWVSRYFGTQSSDDILRSIAVSPDGTKVVVGGETSNANQDFLTIVYNASSGAQLWSAVYNGPGNVFDLGGHVAVSPDGSKVFIAGESWGTSLTPDFATIAYNASSGAQLWVARYNGPKDDDLPHAIATSSDGSKVFVTGRSRGTASDLDFATVAYNASSGAQLWVARYNGTGSAGDISNGVVATPDGSRVIVGGYSMGAGTNYDYATVAYSASSGVQQWASRYNGPANGEDDGWALGMSPNGSEVYLTGGSTAASTGFDVATVAYASATGAQRWVSRYDSFHVTDFAYSIAVAPDGSRVYAAGVGQGGGDDYLTVATALTSSLALNPATVDVVSPSSVSVYLTLSGKLTDGVSGAGIGGATVTFSTSAGPLCSATTAPDGTASCGSVAELVAVAKTLTYSGSFAGNATYLSSSGTAPFARVLGSDV